MAQLKFIHLQLFQTYSNLLKRSTRTIQFILKKCTDAYVSKSTELSARQIFISIRPFSLLLLQQE